MCHLTGMAVTADAPRSDMNRAQRPIHQAGFYIHSAIRAARPEVEAAAHCHSIHGKAWSSFGLPVDILTQDSCLFYDNQAVYHNDGGIVLAPEEGENIAKALGPSNNCCILQNHGLLTLGSTVDEAVYLFSALENQCKVQLMVEAAAANGIKKCLIDAEDAAFTANTIQ
jgi:ribulose-5-phosphate 4-epimerase/fuculose-1-phosphate aldolase